MLPSTFPGECSYDAAFLRLSTCENSRPISLMNIIAASSVSFWSSGSRALISGTSPASALIFLPSPARRTFFSIDMRVTSLPMPGVRADSPRPYVNGVPDVDGEEEVRGVDPVV